MTLGSYLSTQPPPDWLTQAKDKFTPMIEKIFGNALDFEVSSKWQVRLELVNSAHRILSISSILEQESVRFLVDCLVMHCYDPMKEVLHINFQLQIFLLQVFTQSQKCLLSFVGSLPSTAPVVGRKVHYN